MDSIVAILCENLPNFGLSLADFGRFRRISRATAALPATISRRREVFSGAATIARIAGAYNHLAIVDGSARYYLPKFRPGKEWSANVLLVEYGNILYCTTREHLHILRALEYKILTAYTEHNNLTGRLLRSDLITRSAPHNGSVVDALERGQNIIIGYDGKLYNTHIWLNMYTGTHGTRIQFFVTR